MGRSPASPSNRNATIHAGRSRTHGGSCENFRKSLRGVNGHSCDGLAVESAEVGFIASEEGLASVLDGGGEHGAVFFGEEKVEARRAQRARQRTAD